MRIYQSNVVRCLILISAVSFGSEGAGAADSPITATLLQQVSEEWVPARTSAYERWSKTSEEALGELDRLVRGTSESAAQRTTPSEVESSSVLFAPVEPVEIWDAYYAPRMIAIPGGEFTMGGHDKKRRQDEKPIHRVRIASPLLVGKYLVTVGEFAYFVSDSGYKANNGIQGCLVNKFMWSLETDKGWSDPGFTQTPDHPVVCVNVLDARAYVEWLSKKTGHTYRLLTEAEYEWAARGGTNTAYYWGDDFDQSKANCAIRSSLGTKPVGSYPPNPFGLYDMTGNATSYVEDCYVDNYSSAPTDGSAVKSGPSAGGLIDRLVGTYRPNECLGMYRGGSWWVIGRFRDVNTDCESALRVSARGLANINSRNFINGFRVLRVRDQ